MSRKYRHRGYQNEERDERISRGRKSTRVTREGPRSPRMMGFKEALRCATCGVSLPRDFSDIEPTSQCPKCESALHTCRNCRFFDTSSRFECTQAIPKRVSPKDKANECGYFEARTRVEKKTTSSTDIKPTLDPREAFERLFKK